MIGAGAMAEVYKALDKDAWDHLVALKILSSDALSRCRGHAGAVPSRGGRPFEGAVGVRGVDHLAWARQDGWRRGGSLYRHGVPRGARPCRRDPPPEEIWEWRGHSVHEAVDIIVAICEGVHTCHKYMVVHRDIKPANIFLVDTPTGVKPTLLDLSVAKLVQSDDPNRSITQMLVGTPSYMAPEQQAARPATSLSDQYSVTAVLFCCLTGAPSRKEGMSRRSSRADMDTCPRVCAMSSRKACPSIPRRGFRPSSSSGRLFIRSPPRWLSTCGSPTTPRTRPRARR